MVSLFRLITQTWLVETKSYGISECALLTLVQRPIKFSKVGVLLEVDWDREESVCCVVAPSFDRNWNVTSIVTGNILSFSVSANGDNVFIQSYQKPGDIWLFLEKELCYPVTLEGFVTFFQTLRRARDVRVRRKRRLPAVILNEQSNNVFGNRQGMRSICVSVCSIVGGLWVSVQTL